MRRGEKTGQRDVEPHQVKVVREHADPYVGTDDDGNLQLRSASGQGVFANNVDLVRSHPDFFILSEV